MLIISRRGVLGALAACVAAPAVMPQFEDAARLASDQLAAQSHPEIGPQMKDAHEFMTWAGLQGPREKWAKMD
jgi:hypothetical protein